MTGRRQTIVLLVCFSLVCLARSAGRVSRQEPQVQGYVLAQKITVPANIAWTDTGREVRGGDEFYFQASGGISLQKGNPMAFCGPEGYNLRTVQQPIKDKNIGSLIGKVVQGLAVTKDKETGEETKNELTEYFYIGPENYVSLPMTGRLFLGVNENVVGDNTGEFTVLVYTKR